MLPTEEMEAKDEAADGGRCSWLEGEDIECRVNISGAREDRKRWLDERARAHCRGRRRGSSGPAGIKRPHFSHMETLKMELENRLETEAERSHYREQMCLRQERWSLRLGLSMLRLAQEVAQGSGSGETIICFCSQQPSMSYFYKCVQCCPSASSGHSTKVIRDHLPFMHNGCNFLRMRRVCRQGGCYKDLEGVEKKRKGPKAVCVGHCHAPVRLIVAQGGCWSETFIRFCVSFKIYPFIGMYHPPLKDCDGDCKAQTAWLLSGSAAVLPRSVKVWNLLIALLKCKPSILSFWI